MSSGTTIDACLGKGNMSVTQPQPELIRRNTVNTAVDSIEVSVIDLSLQIVNNMRQVVVYIRSEDEDLGELLNKGKEQYSFLFRGMGPAELKKRFLDATSYIKPLHYKEISRDAFEYRYATEAKDTIYTKVEIIHNKK